MPYVKQEIRDSIDFRGVRPKFPGELNYNISAIVDSYIADRGLSYTTLNEIIGVLECAKMELYRRIAIPFEDQKLYDNGEVYHNAIKKLNEPKQLELFPDAEQVTLTGEAKYGETKFG